MIDQGEFFDIPSPCRRICELNNRGYCKGCFRSRDERLYWNQFSTFQKQLVVNLCEKRRQKVMAARTAIPESTANDDISLIQPDLFAQPEENTANPASAQPTTASQSGQSTTQTSGPQFDLF